MPPHHHKPSPLVHCQRILGGANTTATNKEPFQERLQLKTGKPLITRLFEMLSIPRSVLQVNNTIISARTSHKAVHTVLVTPRESGVFCAHSTAHPRTPHSRCPTATCGLCHPRPVWVQISVCCDDGDFERPLPPRLQGWGPQAEPLASAQGGTGPVTRICHGRRW